MNFHLPNHYWSDYVKKVYIILYICFMVHKVVVASFKPTFEVNGCHLHVVRSIVVWEVLRIKISWFSSIESHKVSLYMYVYIYKPYIYNCTVYMKLHMYVYMHIYKIFFEYPNSPMPHPTPPTPRGPPPPTHVGLGAWGGALGGRVLEEYHVYMISSFFLFPTVILTQAKGKN